MALGNKLLFCVNLSKCQSSHRNLIDENNLRSVSVSVSVTKTGTGAPYSSKI